MALRNRPPLEVVYEREDNDVQVDIIAVHGLGANVDWSWTWKDKADPDRLVKWLEDPDMLPAVVPKSRIMLYNYDSRWHADAPRTRLQLCGEDFARAVHTFRRGAAGRPIVFVGHSLGGNVIQQGLLYANSEDDFKDVATSAVGIVFLGSPLSGTKLQFLPHILAAVMSPAGSHAGIIKELAYGDPSLRDKLHSFCRMLNTLSIPTSCFFELYESDYGQRKFVGGVVKGMVVEETSACIPGLSRIPLQADHFKMNKFSGPNDRSFLNVSEEIRKMCADARHVIQRRLHPHPIITDRNDLLTRNPETKDCLRALFLTDPFEDMKATKRKKGGRATGTCDWILGTEPLTIWLSGKCAPSPQSVSTNVLWLHGNPGTGKTTMSMFLAEELSRIFSATTQKTLAYFFCDSSYDTRKTATAVVRGLLLQLLQQHPSLLGHVLPKFEERGAKVFDSFDALWAMLINAGADKATGHKYCIIDALDECEPGSQEMLLDQLQETFGADTSADHELNLSILITSRPYPEIRESLSTFSNVDLSSFKESKRDIDKFIDERVAVMKDKRKYTSKVADQIIQILREKSENTFLWVGLACEELASKGVASKDAVKRLQSMPRGLHSLYKKLLDTALESGGNDGVMIQHLLSFIVVALRPLSVLELATACELYQDEDEEERMQFTMEQIESCRLMVLVQDGKVLLLHQSVKDFLMKPLGSDGHPLIHELEVHASFAARCVDYLMRHVPHAPLPSEPQGVMDEFSSYAADFWPDHARMAKSKFRIKDTQAEFFAVDSQSREAWLRWLRGPSHDPYPFPDIPQQFSVFHVAARWGIVQMVDYALLPQSNQDVLAQAGEFMDTAFVSSEGVTPLEEAATSGYVEVSRRMLDRAMPEMCVSEKVVRAAARNSRNGDEVMELLLVLRRDQITVTQEVLKTAAGNWGCGHEVMELLLNRKGGQIIITEEVVTAAAANTENGHEMIELLLGRRGDEIAITEEVVTTAAENRRSGHKVMKVLLDRKGDQITITEKVVTAAAENGRSGHDVMELLLDRRGAEITITEEVVTAAAANTENGHEMIELLLDRRGAEITITEEVLIAAVWNWGNGHEVMELLLDRRGDEITITEEVIIAAAGNWRNGHEVMKVLLDRKGDQITITKEVITDAAENRENGHEMIEFLLDRRGAEITITEEAVSEIAARFDSFIMALLLDRKGDQITITEDVVIAAAGNWRDGHEMMKVLLDRKGDQLTITEDVVRAIAASFDSHNMAFCCHGRRHHAYSRE